MKYKLFILFSLFLSLAGSHVLGQQMDIITVNLVVQDSNGNKVLWQGEGTAVSFYNKKKAETYVKELQGKVKKQGKGGGEVKLNLGNYESADVCQFIAPVTTATFEIKGVPHKGGIVFVQGTNITLIPVNDLEIEAVVTDSKTLTEITKTESFGGNNPPPPTKHGKHIDFYVPLEIEGKYARDNARVIFKPIAVYRDTSENEYPYCLPRPYVIDGPDYNVTQYRRMAFDWHNDTLGRYVLDSLIMRNHMNARMLVKDRIELERRKDECKVDLETWYTDYNLVYHHVSKNIQSYEIRDPMRYLDYEDLLKELPLDTTMAGYVKAPKREKRESGTQQLSLNFEENKDELSPTDSVGRAQLTDLKDRMRAIISNNEESLLGFNIIGQSSPDGRYDSNKGLGERRLNYLVRELRSAGVPAQIIIGESKVATWDSVAIVLEKDGKTEVAASVRKVVEQFPQNHDRQSIRMRDLPNYHEVIVQAAKRLRTVIYSYKSYINSALSRSEVINRWRTDERYRKKILQLNPYEYYYLFDSITNKKELEMLAKWAYDDRNCRIPVVDEKPLPWPLAAYHLASCKLERNEIDTMVLKPLIYEKVGMINRPMYDASLTQPVCYKNAPAIVFLQVVMMIRDCEFERAEQLMTILPDNAENKKIRLFLKCLDGGYEQMTPEGQEIRDTVCNSSDWNRAVVYTAMRQEGYNKLALELMNDTIKFPNQNDKRLMYMKAIIKSRMLMGNNEDLQPVAEEIYKKVPELFLLCLKDESFYRQFIKDADFTKGVRSWFKEFRNAYYAGGLDSLAAKGFSIDYEAPALWEKIK